MYGKGAGPMVVHQAQEIARGLRGWRGNSLISWNAAVQVMNQSAEV